MPCCGGANEVRGAHACVLSTARSNRMNLKRSQSCTVGHLASLREQQRASLICYISSGLEISRQVHTESPGRDEARGGRERLNQCEIGIALIGQVPAP